MRCVDPSGVSRPRMASTKCRISAACPFVGSCQRLVFRGDASRLELLKVDEHQRPILEMHLHLFLRKTFGSEVV